LSGPLVFAIIIVISMVLQCKLVSGWRLRKQRSVSCGF